MTDLRAMPQLKPSYSMLIGGELVASSSAVEFEATSPATLEPLTMIPRGNAEDAEKALDAANRAFPGWRSTPMSERIRMFEALRERLVSNEHEIVAIEALDMGATVSAMHRDFANTIATIDYFTGVAPQLVGDTMPMGGNAMRMIVRQPLGVATAITAFNHPLYFALHRCIGALLAGNTMVLKPPEQDSITSLLLAEMIADIFPPGVWNVVTGFGGEVGAPLVTHPVVRRIIFTGSVETGKRIFAAGAAAGLKSMAMELGGKNPFIVFPDADIAAAADATVTAMNFKATASQSCMSTSRAFVHEDVHEEYVAALAERMAAIKIGVPLDNDAEMGSLISEVQYDKVMKYIGIGHDEGAELVVGGGRPENSDLVGHYVAPTLFDGVTQQMRIAREEIFGPVLSVLKWNNTSDLLRDANDVDYGLTAASWTNDLTQALRLATELEAGAVWINGRDTPLGMPHGGFKDSGLGRVGCFEDLIANTQLKGINIYL
jgi:acyl-CoA reductase-like NAD-dependent aldehyde dehydrogenase